MYYSKDTILFLNGKFIKAVDAHTDLYSQTLHYGFGAFEGIRAYDTLNGVKIFKAREQVRYFALDGDELTIRTPEQPSATLPGKRVISTLQWKREK